MIRFVVFPLMFFEPDQSVSAEVVESIDDLQNEAVFSLKKGKHPFHI